MKAYVTITQNQFAVDETQTPLGILEQSIEFGNFIKGKDGYTPFIGENGNWWINTTDTGVKAQGDAGADGQDGADGNGIESIVLHTTVGKIKTYRITFTDTTTFDFSVTDGNDGSDGVDGEDGTDGKSVEIQNSGTYIQWRFVGDTNWINIVALADLKGEDGTDGTNETNGNDGEDGKSVELQVSATHIQWRLVGNVDWINLIALSELKGDKGDPGRGIVSFTLESTVGKTKTYRITYTDATYTDIDVIDGNDGQDGTSAYQIYIAGGGTLSEAEFNAAITEVPEHIADETIHHTIEDLDELYEPKKGSDDNYVTDAHLIILDNTSGTNTGDNATNSQYSGLEESKQDKNLIFTDTAASTWLADTTYTTYLYRCELTLSGVAATDIAEVIFAHAQAISGNYSPVSLTATNKVTIYSKVNTAITIPTIIISKN